MTSTLSLISPHFAMHVFSMNTAETIPNIFLFSAYHIFPANCSNCFPALQPFPSLHATASVSSHSTLPLKLLLEFRMAEMPEPCLGWGGKESGRTCCPAVLKSFKLK